MDRKTVLLSLLVIVVLLAGIPESFARPEYVSSLNAEYGVSSCGTCHVDPNGGGARNAYGISFQNQPNHRANPREALIAIGQPPTTATATTATLTTTSSPTPEITKEISDEEETQEETETQEELETPAETAVPKATVTPAAAGFGIVVSLIGLFVSALMVKNNK